MNGSARPEGNPCTNVTSRGQSSSGPGALDTVVLACVYVCVCLLKGGVPYDI